MFTKALLTTVGAVAIGVSVVGVADAEAASLTVGGVEYEVTFVEGAYRDLDLNEPWAGSHDQAEAFAQAWLDTYGTASDAGFGFLAWVYNFHSTTSFEVALGTYLSGDNAVVRSAFISTSPTSVRVGYASAVEVETVPEPLMGVGMMLGGAGVAVMSKKKPASSVKA